jgi:hypothetical protein
MTVIRVPRPSPKAMNPDRVANALLLAQVEHLQHAERRLPLRYRTTIYTHAIRTEGEAARYIREVTEAIHAAHADANADRSKGKRAPKLNPKPSKKPKSPGNASRKKSRKPK